MSDSVRPHRQRPTRLPHPWDSPGKNTGVGCHFLLRCMKVESKVKSLSRVRLLATPWTACSPPGSSVHGIFQARVLEWVPYDSQESLVSCSGSTEVRCLQKSDVNPRSDVKKVLREGHFPFQAQESLPTFLMVSWGTGWDLMLLLVWSAYQGWVHPKLEPTREWRTRQHQKWIVKSLKKKTRKLHDETVVSWIMSLRGFSSSFIEV